MRVPRKGGHYIVEEIVNGVIKSEKFFVNSKKEAIEKFNEKHKKKEREEE